MPEPIRHQLVEFDLLHASLWYDGQQPGLGARFDAEAMDALHRLARNPLHYAIRFDDIRRVNLDSFQHGIFYFIHDDTIVILGVLHGARDKLEELARRRRMTREKLVRFHQKFR